MENTNSRSVCEMCYLVTLFLSVILGGCFEKNLDCTTDGQGVICSQEEGASCNPSTRRCHRNCTSDSMCSGNSRCMGGWCVDCVTHVGEHPMEGQSTCYCTGHADCTSGFCDIYRAIRSNPIGLTPDNTDASSTYLFGWCVPEVIRTNSTLGSSAQFSLYVDRDSCLSTEVANGTKEHPYCEIAQAVQRNSIEQYPHPIRLKSSNYIYSANIFALGMPQTMVIVGPDESESELAGGVSRKAILDGPLTIDGDRFDRSIDVVLEGIDIKNDRTGNSGISCTAKSQSPKLHLRRVTVSPIDPTPQTDAAVMISGCSLEMDRVAIINNNGSALILESSEPAATLFQITNSVFANNKPSQKYSDLIRLKISPDSGNPNERSVFRHNTIFNGGDANTSKVQYSSMNPTRFQLLDNIFIPAQSFPANCESAPQILALPKFEPTSKFKLALSKDDTNFRDKATDNSAIALPGLFSKYLKWDFLGHTRASSGRDVGAFETQ